MRWVFYKSQIAFKGDLAFFHFAGGGLEMKKFSKFLCAVVLVLLPSHVFAAILVYTGQPPSVTAGYSLSDIQSLAVGFTLDDSYTITDIEGWIYGFGTLSLSIYGDANGLPNDSAIFHTTVLDIPLSNIPGHPPEWKGGNNLEWFLNPGTYWAAFEVMEGNTFYGGMPTDLLSVPITSPIAVNGYPDYTWHRVYNTYTLLGFRINGNLMIQDPIKPIDVRIGYGIQRAYLSWQLNYGLQNVSFEIEWNESGGPPQTLITSHSDVVIEGLNYNTEYEFLIQAVHNNIKYPADQKVIVKIPAPLFQTPQIVRHSPILLIPGTAGKATAWDNLGLSPTLELTDMRRHLEDFGLTFGGELLEDYSWRSDINYGTLDHRGDFYTCNYPNPGDAIINNYVPTMNFVDAIIRARNDQSKITLVGQSLGGLRARAYLQKKERYPDDRLVTDKIERLVTIGTPHDGVLSDRFNYEGPEPEPFIDSNNNSQWDSGEEYIDVNANEIYDSVIIEGAWKILLGNADEDEDDFYWGIGLTDYKFNGGYINDKDRYENSSVNPWGRNALRFLVENLRDINGWDFKGQALMEDVIWDSPFLYDLNFFTYGEPENSRFVHLPDIDYRYVIGCNPTGYLHWAFWPSELTGGEYDADWFNDFLYGRDVLSHGGDGFISVASQDFSPWHSNEEKVKSIYARGKNHSTELVDYIGLLEALDVDILRVTALCPVDIIIESPSGLVQSKNYAGIFGARYSEADINGDGNLDKFIEIPLPEQGDYLVTVLPEPGTEPSETYSLEIEQRGIVTVIKQDEPISNLDGTPQAVPINATPYADAGPDQVVMEDETGITVVTLDGSGSTDVGSSAGTNDDIVTFEWYMGSTKFGDGETLDVEFTLGAHEIKLVVADQGGAIDEDTLFVTVALPGDFDLDGGVGSNDLTLFSKNFGCAGCADGKWWMGDLDEDGDVDGDDLAKFISVFGM